MFGKIVIDCTLNVVTGLHIGGSDAFSAIGAVDSPVVRDPLTNDPIIPGSSLKGKLRTLLVRSLNEGDTLPEPNGDAEIVRRLFGSSDPIKFARLQFADAFVSNKKDFEQKGVSLTEIKAENTISRADCQANPRQIERVVAGTEFAVRIVYNVENKDEFDADMDELVKAMRLLQLDYLGGHGSRGSGRVRFSDIKLTARGCSVKTEGLSQHFKEEVEDKELFPIKKKVENNELLSAQT